MQPLNPKAHPYIPEMQMVGNLLQKVRNHALSFREQLIEIGMLDDHGLLTFTPSTPIPRLIDSPESQKRLEEILNSPVPTFSFTIRKYIEEWNKLLIQELKSPIATYLRGSSAFYVIDLPKALEQLIHEFSKGRMDFSDLIHNLHEKWMEESAPKDTDLLDFCRFNEDALRFLTKKHLAKLENVEISEIEGKVPNIAFANKPKPLHPRPQNLLLITHREGERTLDRVSGQPQRCYLFSRDNARILIPIFGGTHEIESEHDGFWQAIIDRIFNQVRFSEEHLEDFQAVLAAAHLACSGKVVWEENDSLQRAIAKVAELPTLDPLIISIKRRIRNHPGHSFSFLILICQKLEPILSSEDLETVYRQCLETVPDAISCSYQETMATLYALACFYLYYEDTQNGMHSVATDQGVYLSTEDFNIWFPKRYIGKIHSEWIRPQFELNCLIAREDPPNLELWNSEDPLLQLLLTKARQRPLTPFSQEFIESLTEFCLDRPLGKDLAILLHPLLNVSPPYDGFALILAIAKADYKKVAMDLFHKKILKEGLPKDPKLAQQLKNALSLVHEKYCRNKVKNAVFPLVVAFVCRTLDWPSICSLLYNNAKALVQHLPEIFSACEQPAHQLQLVELLRHSLFSQHSSDFYQSLFSNVTKQMPNIEKAVRALLKGCTNLSAVASQPAFIDFVIEHHIPAPAGLKSTLQPSNLEQFRGLEKLGYYSSQIARVEVQKALAAEQPELIETLTTKEKKEVVNALKKDAMAANRFVFRVFSSPSFTLDKKFQWATTFQKYPWKEIAVALADAPQPLDCLFKFTPKASKESMEAWRVGLQQFTLNPRPLKNNELSKIIDAIELLSHEEGAASWLPKISMRLLPYVDVFQMDKRAALWMLYSLAILLDRDPNSQPLQSLFRRLMISFIRKPDLQNYLILASIQFKRFPVTEEGAALLLSILKIGSLEINYAYYDALKIYIEPLAAKHLNTLSNLIRSTHCGIFLATLLELWAEDPRFGAIFHKNLAEYIMFTQWLFPVSEHNDRILFKSLTALVNTPHGRAIPALEPIYTYLVLILQEDLKPEDIDALLEAIPSIFIKSIDKEEHRFRFYNNFVQLISNRYDGAQLRQFLAKFFTVIIKVEVLRSKSTPPLTEELTELLGVILDAIVIQKAESYYEPVLRSTVSLLKHRTVQYASIPSLIPFLEYALLIGIALKETHQDLFNEMKQRAETILLDPKNQKLGKIRYYALLYWGCEKNLEFKFNQIQNIKYCWELLRLATLTLLTRGELNAARRGMQIISTEFNSIKQNPTITLVTFFSDVIQRLQIHKTIQKENEAEWNNLITAFAIDAITYYPYATHCLIPVQLKTQGVFTEDSECLQLIQSMVDVTKQKSLEAAKKSSK